MLSRRTAVASLAASTLAGAQQQDGNPPPGMFADAEAYDRFNRFMGRCSGLLAPLLVDFTGLPHAAGPALDAGSGTGALAFSIAKLRVHCHVTGIDPSKEYVAYANAKNPFPGRARFQVGDAQQLEFSAASFENSLSLLVFNFIPDPMKAWRELIRVTKPGVSSRPPFGTMARG